MIDINASTVTTFVDFALKGFLILAMAYAFDSLFKKANSNFRNLIWIIALSAVLLLPFISAMLPQMELPLLRLLPQEEAILDDATLLNTDLADMETRGFSLSLMDIFGIAVVIYLLGVLTVVIWQIVGHLYARNIRNTAILISDPGCTEPFTKIRDKFELAGNVRLLKSEKATKPFSSGIIKPAIILPLDACSWPHSILKSVITHEVAHIKRLDIAYRAIAQLACAVNWFNPLSWFGLKKLLIEQEIACDEFVLNAGIKPSVYAQSLLAVANVKHARLDFAMAAIGRKGELKDRLFEILRPTRSRRQLSIRFAALALFVSVLMLIPVFMVNIWNDNSSLKASNLNIKSEEGKEIPVETSQPENSGKENQVKEKEKTVSEKPSEEQITRELISKKLQQMKKNGASDEEIKKFAQQAKKKLEAQSKESAVTTLEKQKKESEAKKEKSKSEKPLTKKEDIPDKKSEPGTKKKEANDGESSKKKLTEAERKKAELAKQKEADLKKIQKEKEKKKKNQDK